MAKDGQKTVRIVFDWLCENPEELPEMYRQRLESEARELVIRDYVAGMTDRFAQEMSARVSGAGT
jgi:dGTP triphosphohydrolase